MVPGILINFFIQIIKFNGKPLKFIIAANGNFLNLVNNASQMYVKHHRSAEELKKHDNDIIAHIEI